MFEILYAGFWFVCGAVFAGLCVHFYKNDKIREVIKDEREKAEKAINDARQGLKSRL